MKLLFCYVVACEIILTCWMVRDRKFLSYLLKRSSYLEFICFFLAAIFTAPVVVPMTILPKK